MATLVLGFLGNSISANIGSGITASGIKILSAVGGAFIDRHINSRGGDSGRSGRVFGERDKVDVFAVSAASPKDVIPLVYGTARVEGHLIWASKLHEHISRKGSHTSVTHTLSFAVAVCAGEANVLKIWRNGEVINILSNNIRIYNGTEDQMPDSLIEATYGVGKTPAFRGLTYVVFQDMNISNFNNQKQVFAFEVFKSPKLNEEGPESNVKAVVMLPGNGAFVYDTEVGSRYKNTKSFDQDKDQYIDVVDNSSFYMVNCNCYHYIADALLSLNNLKSALPKVEWIAVTVNWFCFGINIKDTNVFPAAEYNDNDVGTSPNKWSVQGKSMLNVHRILYNDETSCFYEGTVDDMGLVRYLTELRKRGYKVLLYPILLPIDNPKQWFEKKHKNDGDKLTKKFWRGDMYGDLSDIKQFFTKEAGYNNFITHYAKLCSKLVDAFIIGSEFVNLTSMYDEKRKIFPAVDELINLAEGVRKIVGSKVLLSYAADWAEYNFDQATGIYNLDPLWSNPVIDFIGINAYFPLTDLEKKEDWIYEVDEIAKCWRSGEGYDYVYDESRYTKKPVKDKEAWKNIEWWRSNKHVNPDGKCTNWVPNLKKIWFTEYGFPSVDLATNQPGLIYEKGKCCCTSLPRYSNGNTDCFIQRVAIWGTQKAWEGSDCVERMFLRGWDARPYPTWPFKSERWGDAIFWEKGHWIQGKFGRITLDQVITHLCELGGVDKKDIEADSLTDIVDGFVIYEKFNVSELIIMLQEVYFFDVFEDKGKIVFRTRRRAGEISIDSGDFIDVNAQRSDCVFTQNESNLVDIKILKDVDVPRQISVDFFDIDEEYAVARQTISSKYDLTGRAIYLAIPLAFSYDHIFSIFSKWLALLRVERFKYVFHLPLQYYYLCPSDVVKFYVNSVQHTAKIISFDFGINEVIRVTAVAENPCIYDADMNISSVVSKNGGKSGPESMLTTYYEVMDLPVLPYDVYDRNAEGLRLKTMMPRLFLAASGNNKEWRGCNIEYKVIDLPYFYEVNGSGTVISSSSNSLMINKQSILGKALTILGPIDHRFLDSKSNIIVQIVHGSLQTIPEDELFSNKFHNLALIGNEIIQFARADLIGKNTYRLTKIIRGICGTENTVHNLGERFLMLEKENTAFIELNSECYNKDIVFTVSTINVDSVLDRNQNKTIRYEGNYMRPISPTEAMVQIEGNDRAVLTWTARILSYQLFGNLGSDEILKKNDINFVVRAFFNNNLIEEVHVGEGRYILSDQVLKVVSEQGSVDFSVTQYDVYNNLESTPCVVHYLGNFKSIANK